MPEGREIWDEDGDEQIRKAIELHQTPPPKMISKEVICIDSEEEDLNFAFRRKPVLVPPHSEQTRLSVSPPHQAQRPAPSLGCLPRIERKQIEQERLARAKHTAAGKVGQGADTLKRKMGDINRPPSRRVKVHKAQESETVPASQFYSRGGSTTGSESPEEACELRTQGPEKGKLMEPRSLLRLGSELPSEDGLGIQFPYGVVRKTFLEEVERKGDDITIEEVLQKGTLREAVLSAFMWDPDWILNKVDVRSTSLVLVMHAKLEQEKERLKKMFSVLPNVALVFPNMSGQINCMHSKLMLLFHEEYLRVVIPTANLVKFDWGGNKGIMENTVFLIDLPKIQSDQGGSLPGLTHFAKELIYFCEKKGLPPTVLNKLRKMDYSTTASLAFVHSIGGSQTGGDCERTGYLGLATAVRTLGLQSSNGLLVDYVTSSVGALDRQFLTCLYRAVMGDNQLLKEFQQSWGKSGKSNLAALKATTPMSSFFPGTSSKGSGGPAKVQLTWEDIMDRFRVYFPTYDTVNESKGGRGAGGTICFRREWWSRPSFPKETLRDCVSTRGKVLMHNKLLFARPAMQLRTPNGIVDAYAYVGSANLSESAWGKLVMDRATKTPKLNVRNWECGVLIPVVADAKEVGDSNAGRVSGQEAKNGAKPLDMIFGNTIPVPMQTTTKKIAAGRVPWFYED